MSGAWERDTFETLEQFLDKDTVYVDIGAWIGVTPFWGARHAKYVVAIEPDPVCFKQLCQLKDENSGTVDIVHAALSEEESVDILPVKVFGSSETSVLVGDRVRAFRVNGISTAAVTGLTKNHPYFVKIDIEGYEYTLGRALRRLVSSRLKGLQLAIHPQILEKSRGGSFLWRRVRTLWETLRLVTLIPACRPKIINNPRTGLLQYILCDIVFTRKCRGADLLFQVK